MVRLYFFLLLSLMGFTSNGWANGAYFPPHTISDHPSIPSQTAFIRHDPGGIQTLIVESAAEVVAEGSSFEWILPITSQPSVIEPVGRSMLTVLRSLINHEVVTGIHPTTVIFTIFGVIFSLFLSVKLYASLRHGLSWTQFLVESLLLLLIALFLLAISTPSFLEAGSGTRSSDGVTLLKQDSVGSYDVVVLRADNAMVLDGCLGKMDLLPWEASVFLSWRIIYAMNGFFWR